MSNIEKIELINQYESLIHLASINHEFSPKDNVLNNEIREILMENIDFEKQIMGQIIEQTKRFQNNSGVAYSVGFYDGRKSFEIDIKEKIKELEQKEEVRSSVYNKFEEARKHEFHIGYDLGRDSYKILIKARMKALENKHNNFRDMTFNVPTQVERDFIAYETLKSLLSDKCFTEEENKAVENIIMKK